MAPTLIWTAVHHFVLLECGFIMLLLLDRPVSLCLGFRRCLRRYQAVLHNWLKVPVLLIMCLWVDAIRTVNEAPRADHDHDSVGHCMGRIHTLRAQRNLFLSGFAFFLYVVAWRLLGIMAPRDERDNRRRVN